MNKPNIKNKIKKINKQNIKNKTNRVKSVKINLIYKNNKKKLGILSVLILLLTISSLYLVKNHASFMNLNDKMIELSIKPYDEHNIFIKPKTLDNMKNKIKEQISEFNSWYDQNIKLEEENLKRRTNLLNSDRDDEFKYQNLDNIYIDDLKIKITTKKKEFLEKVNRNINYNKDEEKIKNKINNLKNIEENSSLKSYLDYYIELLKKITNINNLIQKVEARELEEAEEKAAKEAEEKAAKEAEEETKKETENNNGSYSIGDADLSNKDGNYNRGLANSLFTAINSYRSSLGLTPYSYASNKQSCVDKEAQAYANTNNPHNWICDVANENASISSIGSDAVGIAMNFFVNDPPHERVLSGNYTSCAVSIVEQNGMYYMIVGVF